MSDFTHIVFTRINCNYPVDPSYPQSMYDRVADKQFNHNWLRDRIRHMKVLTEPSIRNQTTTNFHWVILLHPKTNPKFVAEFEEFAKGAKRFKVVTTDQSPRVFLPEYIKANVKTPWVITTTLDSDDALSNNFIEHVQSHFAQRKEYLNVTRGFKYIPNHDPNSLFGCHSLANPYISLVESTDEAKGVYCIVHGGAHHHASVRQIDHPQVGWVQLIHGDNLVNRAKWRKSHGGWFLDRVKREGYNFSVDFKAVEFKK
jgi:hypothetical protein